jgi:hypothetical protein
MTLEAPIRALTARLGTQEWQTRTTSTLERWCKLACCPRSTTTVLGQLYEVAVSLRLIDMDIRETMDRWTIGNISQALSAVGFVGKSSVWRWSDSGADGICMAFYLTDQGTHACGGHACRRSLIIQSPTCLRHDASSFHAPNCAKPFFGRIVRANDGH